MTLQAFSMFSPSEKLHKYISVTARGFVAVRLLGLRVPIPPEASVSYSRAVFCQGEVSATARSLVQGRPIARVCVCVCVKVCEQMK